MADEPDNRPKTALRTGVKSGKAAAKNPAALSEPPPPLPGYYAIASSCTSCEACVAVCPTLSIFYGEGQFVIDSDSCQCLAVCVAVCPVDVILLVPTDASK